jgi:hypothetical protein
MYDDLYAWPFSADPLRKLESIAAARHVNVREHDIGMRAGLEDRDRFVRIARFDDAIAATLQMNFLTIRGWYASAHHNHRHIGVDLMQSFPYGLLVSFLSLPGVQIGTAFPGVNVSS